MDWKQILQATLNYVFPIAVAYVVAKLLPKLFPATQAGIDWLKGQAANVHNQFAAGLLNRVISLVGQKVLAFEQTFIEDMKTKVASGRINLSDVPAILKDEKDKLLTQLKAELTAQNLWEDVKGLLGGEDSLVMKWLDTVLEAQVAQLPASGLQTRPDPTVGVVPSSPVAQPVGAPPVPAPAVPPPAAA